MYRATANDLTVATASSNVRDDRVLQLFFIIFVGHSSLSTVPQNTIFNLNPCSSHLVTTQHTDTHFLVDYVTVTDPHRSNKNTFISEHSESGSECGQLLFFLYNRRRNVTFLNKVMTLNLYNIK